MTEDFNYPIVKATVSHSANKIAISFFVSTSIGKYLPRALRCGNFAKGKMLVSISDTVTDKGDINVEEIVVFRCKFYNIGIIIFLKYVYVFRSFCRQIYQYRNKSQDNEWHK